MIEATLGNPTTPGLYCARQWYAYRILEWDGEKWWHPGKGAEWGNAEIEAHIGPLPAISKDHTKPPPHRGRDNRTPQRSWNEVIGTPPKLAQEFDL